jgi:hypothetical protein
MDRHLPENDGRPGREITATATYLLDRHRHRTIPMDGMAPNIQMRTEIEIETDLPEVASEVATAMQRLSIPIYRAMTESGMEGADANPHEMIDGVTTGMTLDGMTGTGDGVANMTTGCGPAGQGVAVGHPFVTGTVTVTVITGGVRRPIVSRSDVTTGWEDIGHRAPLTTWRSRHLMLSPLIPRV